jgi:SAM-dependent methyltransferase
MPHTSSVFGPLWGARARDWAEIQEAGSRPLYESALGRLAIGEGMRMVDLGCGAGGFCMLAAERGAAVAGLDAAEGMLEIARERTPGGDFRQGDLEALPWGDAAFDVATAFNSFQFAGDPDAADREAGRVVRPEGKVVVAIWGDREQNDALATMDALAELSPPPPDSPGPFALSGGGRLEHVVEEAGLVIEEVHDVPCPWVYPDLDTAVRGLASGGGSRRVEQEVGREAVEQAIARALQPFGDGTGVYRLENVFRYLVAQPA